MARAKNNTVTKIPAGEKVEVTMPYPSGNLYLITYNLAKDIRTLWRKMETGYECMQTDDSPMPLYDLVNAAEAKKK